MAISQLYGRMKDGRRVEHFLLRNRNGMEVGCIGYGCRLTHFLIPSILPRVGSVGKTTKLVDILLGYDTIEGYEADKLWHGALLGRYAGRIKSGSFRIGNRRYQISRGEGGNFLHGSLSGLLFDGEVVADNTVRFTATSSAGEDGFPGNLWLSVTYSLTEENELVMDYRAETDEETYLNLSNHSYFNMSGNQSGSAMNGLLTINSSALLELDKDLLPTGEVLPVAGTPFDFRTEKPVGRDIVSRHEQLYLAKGYDHCYILHKPRARALTHAATFRDGANGRSLAIYTTQPGLQLYTGNFITGSEAPGKGGQVYMRRSGVCFETMHYPDSPNHAIFPTTLLKPGEGYHETTVLAADWKTDV